MNFPWLCRKHTVGFYTFLSNTYTDYVTSRARDFGGISHFLCSESSRSLRDREKDSTEKLSRLASIPQNMCIAHIT